MRLLHAWMMVASFACCAGCTTARDSGASDDAAAFSRMHGVSLAEAKRMLAVQEASSVQTEALLQSLEPRLAGAYWTAGPGQHLVVRLTGSAPGGATSIDTPSGRLAVEYRLGALHSRQALVAALEAHQALIRQRIPDAEGMGVDQRTGSIAIDVNAGGEQFAAYEADAVALERLVGVPLRLVRVSGPAPSHLH